MSEHSIHDESMQEIVESFVVEAREIYDGLEADLLQLEKTPDDQELVDQIFRDVHTVKGTASFLDLEQLSTLAHEFEEVLGKMREGDIDFQSEMTDVMLHAFDHMKTLTQQVVERDLQPLVLDDLLEALRSITEGSFEPNEVSLGEVGTPAESGSSAGGETEGEPGEGGEAPDAEQSEKAGGNVDGDGSEGTSDHAIHDEGMQEIVKSFIVEAEEIYDGLEADLLQLEQTPDDEELVDQIFRDVHTVKGTAGFLNLEQLSDLAHDFEEVLGKLREGEVDFDPAMTDVMLCAFDHMKVLTQQVVDRKLQTLDLGDLPGALQAITDGTFDPDEVTLPEAGPSTEDVGSEGGSSAATGSEEEAVQNGTGSTEPGSEGDAGSSSAGSARRSESSAPDTIRVEISRLNDLMDLVGELVLGRNRLVQLISDVQATTGSGARLQDDESSGRLEELLSQLEDARDKVDYTTTELQSAVMRARMVQIGQVFSKFPRVVRDLSREFDKEIDLVVEGEDTELDKSLVEEIGDPLLHLVRNAADHGIETPAEREEKGKDPCGEIRLSAAHAGNHIVIEIEDDGAGLDADALRQTAVEKGITTESEAEEMGDAEAYQLIFEPGFSTTEEASQVSGRGVGMDVVKTNLAELNGTIEIDSTPGEGTCFTMKLPLTLAILRSMLIRSGAEKFAIPLYAVSEAVRLGPDMVDTIQGGEVMEHRDQIIPIIRLADALDVPVPNAGGEQMDEFSDQQGSYAVIVNVAHRRAALVVDDLIAQEEVVIKSLGEYLKAVPGLAGSTILGDGQVIMVLDIGELVQMVDQGETEVGMARALNENGETMSGTGIVTS